MCCCFQWCTVVILAIRHYPNLCRDTCFVTGVDKIHRNTTCPNLQCFNGYNEGCISPWFPYTIRGRRHWTICWQGKADFLESVGRTWPRRWQNTGTFTASSSEAAIVAIKAFLSVIFVSHWTDESSRCKVVAFQEETGAMSPPLPSFTSSSYNASPVYEAMTWYNDGIPNPGLPQPVDYG